MKLHLARSVPVVAFAVIVAGCSSGTSGTHASSSSSSSSASSTSAETAPNPLAAKAGDEYKAYAIDQIDQLIAKVKVLTDAVRAGNLKVAQVAFVPTRRPWGPTLFPYTTLYQC